MTDLIVPKPIEARTDLQIAKLPRDNFPASTGKWSVLLHEDSVFLSEPHGRDGHIIPRAQWDVICKWYMGVVP